MGLGRAYVKAFVDAGFVSTFSYFDCRMMNLGDMMASLTRSRWGFSAYVTFGDLNETISNGLVAELLG